MKITWEASDISAGRVFGKPSVSERWMIGYHTSKAAADSYCCISLSDGMVSPGQQKDDLARELTIGGYIPQELLL